MEKFGVTPDKVVDVQALAGDSTDNVPGAPGIGVKTAAQLINEYGDVETLLIAHGRDQAAQAARIARAERRADPHLQAAGDAARRRADAGRRPRASPRSKPDPNVLLPWLQKQGFKSLVAKYAKELGAPDAAIEPMASIAPAPQLPQAARPAPAPRAKSNKPFTTEDYELIRTEAALDEWIVEATKAGMVGVMLRDRRGRAQTRRPWSACRSPCSRARGATSIRSAAAAPICRSAIARPGEGAKGTQGALDLAGDGGAKLLPGPVGAQDGARQAEAAARGPERSEGRPEPQARHVGARAARHQDRAGRRHHAAELRARRRQAQPRHGGPRRALSRPEGDEVLRRRGLGRQAGELRPRADRAGDGVRRPAGRSDPAALGAVQAAARRRSTW